MKIIEKELDFKTVFQSLPIMGLLLSPDSPDFTIIESTNALLLSTQTKRQDIIGKKLFEAFPDNPANATATGVKNLRQSLDKVIATLKPHRMPVQRYDVERSDGTFEELYWQPVNTPIINEDANLSYIFHCTENVTSKILDQRQAKTVRENFEYFFNQALAPFAILTGKDFVFTFANAAYVQLMNGRELVGKCLDEAIPELRGQQFILLLEKVFETGIPFHATEIAATAVFENNAEPETRYFNLSYIPYKNQRGIIEGVLASGYDVTSQVELRKKEKVRGLNMQAYNLFMQAPVGFSLVKGDEFIVDLVNSMGLQLTGKSEEIIGKSLFDIFPENKLDGYVEIMNRVKSEGESLYLKESPVRLKKDGAEEMLYHNVVFQPYYEGNDITGILTISTDVTEQVLARKKVEEAEEKARVAIESAELGVYEGDLLSNKMTGDVRFYELFGFDHWVHWNDLISVIHPDDLGIREKAHEESLLTGKLYYEARIIYKDKSVHWLKIYGKVFYDEENTPFKLLGVAEDITEQKQFERQKDDFLSMASHELKTPVTTIKAYAQIAESMLDAKKDVETLGIIKRMSNQVNKLTALIEDLLDITKIQKGKLIYNEAYFDFNELVTEVIDDMQKTSSTHTIQYHPAERTNIFGDREKLSQVLNNLMSNAIKYSPKADSIVVKTESQHNGVQLYVQDFGIGISPQAQKNVFEQFYRVNGENQSTYPGMGIGLYICEEIISRQGGKIWLESYPDEGSIFYIWLPFDHRLKST
jgi:PAS domain S-box-containing protein